MDIGRILRERANFAAFRYKPKRRLKRWGVFPSLKVEQLIFHEDNDFRCLVSLFSYDRDDVEKMQDMTIAEAVKGMKKNGWEFYCHAANHKIERVQKMYRSEINFVFKVRFPDNTQEEVKQNGS